MLVDRDGEKVTLGSFLFRDDCHSLLLRLVTVSSSIFKIHGASPAAATGAMSRASLEGNFVDRDEPPAEGALPEPSESAPGTAISNALAVESRPCDNFETMVEAVLPCTTAQVLFLESASRMLLVNIPTPANFVGCVIFAELGAVAIEFPLQRLPPCSCGSVDNPSKTSPWRLVARCSLGCGDGIRRFGRISCALREKPALIFRNGDRRH